MQNLPWFDVNQPFMDISHVISFINPTLYLTWILSKTCLYSPRFVCRLLCFLSPWQMPFARISISSIFKAIVRILCWWTFRRLLTFCYNEQFAVDILVYVSVCVCTRVSWEYTHTRNIKNIIYMISDIYIYIWYFWILLPSSVWLPGGLGRRCDVPSRFILC